ncbi:hypothetical protein [Streptomyces sp. NPDC015242]|uniref:hypothetical protein n=1 Tax=Streptomyces sp. NPDC015242 TaxID=3364951 RepID=UPI0036FF665E
MTATADKAGSERPMRRAKAARVTTGIAAVVVALVLALALTSSPERFGLSASPEVFENVHAEGRSSEAFIFVWALIALPVAGLLHTPSALARRARVGTGWALVAGYWLYVVLTAAVAWEVARLFPATDAPGKEGGLFGAAILLVVSPPLFVVSSGGVFREGRERGTPVRDQLTAFAILCCSFIGLVAGLTTGYNFSFPRAGFPAVFLPGGALWGLTAGAAVGMGIGAVLTASTDRRRTLSDDAKSFARTATALLALCLSLSQLGWLLPSWAVALIGVPAPFVLFATAGHFVWLERWVQYRQIELPKGALH